MSASQGRQRIQRTVLGKSQPRMAESDRGNATEDTNQSSIKFATKNLQYNTVYCCIHISANWNFSLPQGFLSFVRREHHGAVGTTTGGFRGKDRCGSGTGGAVLTVSSFGDCIPPCRHLQMWGVTASICPSLSLSIFVVAYHLNLNMPLASLGYLCHRPMIK